MIEGKKGIRTRIISAYRPCKSTSGLETAYTQHIVYWNSAARNEDPRQIFMDDLKYEIQKWQEQGEQIILCGDFNTGDKSSPQAATQFWKPWLDEISLIDVHKTSSGMEWLPPTHERGSTQIDYIFISPSIQIKRAGFLPFNKVPGDHRAIWVDIQTDDIIGYNPPQLSMSTARRLKSDNPTVRNRYLSLLKQYAQQDGILMTLSWLDTVPLAHWNESYTQIYEVVTAKLKIHMMEAERKCRKLHTGRHPFSAELSTAQKKFFFWELVVKDK